VQAYFDRADRNMPGVVDDTLDTWDIELQQTSRPGGSHDLLWGAGYRLYNDRLTNLAPAALLFDPADRKLRLWNLFAQDEFSLAQGVRATLGIKAEHNSYTGLEWLPTARISWQPGSDQLLWASVSRAVRTPSRIDRDVTTPQLTLGGSNFDSEVAQVFEIGYRAQPLAALSYSLTLFHHDFERLRSVDVLPAGIAFGNSYEGRLTGLEAWGSWRLAERWRLQAGYTHQRLRIGAPAGSPVLPGSESQLGNDPRNQAQAGLSWDVAANMEVDLLARYVSTLPNPLVPSYTAIDLRWGWRPRPDLDLSIAVRNLNDPRHAEWGPAGSRAEIPRSFMFKAVWRL
jgi:iron complex outermembrane recepter protein